MPTSADDQAPVREQHFYDSQDIARLLDTPCRACDRAEVLAEDDCVSGSSACDRWTTARARRWLKSTKAGVKRGRFWITTRERLREHFPELWDLIVLRSVGDED